MIHRKEIVPARRAGVSLLILLVIGLFVPFAAAQEGGGIIVGHIQDSSGAAIAGATVNVTNVATGQQTILKSNNSGNYTTPSLALGPYSVLVVTKGFRSAERRGISLQVDSRLQINFTLQPGNVSQTVTVSAEGNEVNTTTPEMGTVFNSRAIEQLPVNGRSVLALAQLTPGVNRNSGQVNEGFADRGTLVTAISINNGPNAMNAINLDGQSILQTYEPETSLNPTSGAVAEFKVESGVLPAELGFTAGGAVSMVSQSGTAHYHGQLYEFLRNDAFDARNYFNPHPSRVDELRYNQFGGAIGGPIAKRTVFFGNYEGYRFIDGNEVIASVPTEAWREGDFSDLRGATGKLIPLYDPRTTSANPNGNGDIREPFAGNIVPPSLIDPVAKAINQYYPLPNHAPANAYTQSDNYYGPSANHRWMRQYLIRVDHTFSSKDTAFARYAYYKHFTDTGGNIYSIIEPFMGLRDDNDGNQAALVEETHIFSPTWINELRLSLLRTNFTFVTSSNGGGWPQKLGLPDSWPAETFPRMSNGFPAASTSAVGKRAGTSGEFSDIVTLVRGNHNFRFGVDWRLNRGYNLQTAEPSGLVSFSSNQTDNPQKTSGSGYAYASFLLGAVSSAEFDTVLGTSDADYSISGFLEDHWKATSRLTLDLGLRYDFQQYPVEQNNGVSNFNLDATDPLGLKGKMQYAGVDGAPRRFRNNDPTNFGPRIGFAWDLFGDGSTSIRGGYGIYYPTIFAFSFFGNTTGFASTVTNYTSPGGDKFYPSFYLSNGLASPPTQPLGATLGPDGFLGQSVAHDVQNDGTTPMSQQWDLSVQHALPWGIVVDVAYAGNHGTHFVAGSYNINQLNPKYLALGSQLQNSVPNPYAGMVPGALGAPQITLQQSLLAYPYYQSVDIRSPHDGNFIGHAGELSVTKRSSHGLTFILGYTKTKLIDDSIVSDIDYNGVVAATDTGYQNAFDRSAERSIDPLDHSQMLNVSVLYELPFGRGKTFGRSAGPFMNRLIGGWQLNTITSWHTGLPVAITGANNFAASRPNYVAGAKVKLAHPTIREWFNTEAFINPPNYTFGDVSRTLPNVRGPQEFNSDISLFKTTDITERWKTEFRVEAFNALNHPNFGMPSGSFSAGPDGLNQSGTFGTITAATDGRALQFALKVLF